MIFKSLMDTQIDVVTEETKKIYDKWKMIDIGCRILSLLYLFFSWSTLSSLLIWLNSEWVERTERNDNRISKYPTEN